MDSTKKKPWTKPVLRRWEATDELLQLFADKAKDKDKDKDKVAPPAKYLK